MEHWNYSKIKPFLINFLYVLPVGNRINRKRLLDLKILKGLDNEMRGLNQISKEEFLLILRECKVNESFIVD